MGVCGSCIEKREKEAKPVNLSEFERSFKNRQVVALQNGVQLTEIQAYKVSIQTQSIPSLNSSMNQNSMNQNALNQSAMQKKNCDQEQSFQESSSYRQLQNQQSVDYISDMSPDKDDVMVMCDGQLVKKPSKKGKKKKKMTSSSKKSPLKDDSMEVKDNEENFFFDEDGSPLKEEYKDDIDDLADLKTRNQSQISKQSPAIEANEYEHENDFERKSSYESKRKFKKGQKLDMPQGDPNNMRKTSPNRMIVPYFDSKNDYFNQNPFQNDSSRDQYVRHTMQGDHSGSDINQKSMDGSQAPSSQRIPKMVNAKKKFSIRKGGIQFSDQSPQKTSENSPLKR